MLTAIINAFFLYHLEINILLALFVASLSTRFFAHKNFQTAYVAFFVAIWLPCTAVSIAGLSLRLSVDPFFFTPVAANQIAPLGFQEVFVVDKDQTNFTTTVMRIESSINEGTVEFDLESFPRMNLKTLDCENPEDCYSKFFQRKEAKVRASFIRVEFVCDGDVLSCLSKVKRQKKDVVQVIDEMARYNIKEYRIKI